MVKKSLYLQRCFDLARLGAGGASPNPVVGAVLVNNDRIIGEGFHQMYGAAHAEVNCLKSVAPHDQHLIKNSTLYISLEPCCIVGNTPACTEMIRKNGIKKVVYATVDPTSGVNGQSKKILENYGAHVEDGILQTEGNQLIRPRSVWINQKRPYIILKFAQSKDGFIGQKEKQVWLSNSYTKTLVHKWRSEVDAIIVGTNTAVLDNPKLTTRLYPGKNPLRIVLDKSKRLKKESNLLDNSTPTWVVTKEDHSASDQKNTTHLQMPFDQLLPSLNHELFKANKGILMVEGGAQLIDSYLKANLWDEARIFQTDVLLDSGIEAPKIDRKCAVSFPVKNNLVKYYFNNE